MAKKTNPYTPEKKKAGASDIPTTEDYQAWQSEDEAGQSSLPSTPQPTKNEYDLSGRPMNMQTTQAKDMDNIPAVDDKMQEYSSPNWVAYPSDSPSMPSSPPVVHKSSSAFHEEPAPGHEITEAAGNLGSFDTYSMVRPSQYISVGRSFLRPSLSYASRGGVPGMNDLSSNTSIDGIAITEEFHASAFQPDTDEDEESESHYDDYISHASQAMTSDNEYETDENSGQTLQKSGPSDDTIEFENYKRELEKLRASMRIGEPAPQKVNRDTQTSLILGSDEHDHAGVDNSSPVAGASISENRVPDDNGDYRRSSRKAPNGINHISALSWILLMLAYTIGLLIIGYAIWEIVAFVFRLALGIFMILLRAIYSFKYRVAAATAYKQVRAGMRILDEAIEVFIGPFENDV
ncbi:hypothetical protein Dda_1548 [Drechslerella dactyloides]|uniref:Uncharacterized protein n=1 Tax=Drechslerella dactyloides TaxID=74499 RepID=A0AAD6NM34_DREDA|nr:hypothetical protein Dda_1548 [Drechslerella dactyloides]